MPRVSCNSSWKITWTAILIYLVFLIQQIAILDLRRESQLIDGWSPPVLHFQAVHLFTRSSILIITFIFVVVFITVMIIIIKRFPEPETYEELMDFRGWRVLYFPIHGRLGGGTIPPNSSIPWSWSVISSLGFKQSSCNKEREKLRWKAHNAEGRSPVGSERWGNFWPKIYGAVPSFYRYHEDLSAVKEFRTHIIFISSKHYLWVKYHHLLPQKTGTSWTASSLFY